MKDLQQIASISGKGGLFKIIKPTRSGVILEALDGTNKKSVANAQSRVSILKEISIYTTTSEGTIMLEDVLVSLYKKYGKEVLPIDSKASSSELYAFLEEVAPSFDEERVYPSDVKKIINWYGVLIKYYPQLFDTPAKEEKPKEKKTASSKKTTAKKKTSPKNKKQA